MAQASLTDLLIRCRRDPLWESIHVSKRPLRLLQAEIISRVEKFISAHDGGVMPILSARQTGKNETSAVLQRRHLWRRQLSPHVSSWIRTAPTHKPQIVNSKKRLKEILQLDAKKRIRHPIFNGEKLQQEEGYIWKVGNATVEFLSSSPTANVVGATASECLDMDEAHKVIKAKFDEDFAPFTANTNAATLLWGVASNGMDTIEWYRQNNAENGRKDLNLFYPCEVWMDANPIYAAHVEGRMKALGPDHPIIKTQYRLIPVAQEGSFLSKMQAESILSGTHERQKKPNLNSRYHVIIDIAAGNEDFNPDDVIEGEEETDTDSTIAFVYEVTSIVAANGIFPVVRIVDMLWMTGVSLPAQQPELESFIEKWRADKVTVDGVGVGRQIAEALETKFGTSVVNKYIANETSVSEDCFDLLARTNYDSVLMFQNDGSPEWAEFERQLKWTKYASNKGKMKLIKPKSDKHIDMVKALTYINQNSPASGAHELYFVEGNYV